MKALFSLSVNKQIAILEGKRVGGILRELGLYSVGHREARGHRGGAKGKMPAVHSVLGTPCGTYEAVESNVKQGGLV
jgi:hypothetical protein